jgi:hypothetical protein
MASRGIAMLPPDPRSRSSSNTFLFAILHLAKSRTTGGGGGCCDSASARGGELLRLMFKKTALVKVYRNVGKKALRCLPTRTRVWGAAVGVAKFMLLESGIGDS